MPNGLRMASLRGFLDSDGMITCRKLCASPAPFWQVSGIFQLGMILRYLEGVISPMPSIPS